MIHLPPIVPPHRPLSDGVVSKNGYLREGVVRSIAEQHGRRVDLVMFARLAEDPAPEDLD